MAPSSKRLVIRFSALFLISVGSIGQVLTANAAGRRATWSDRTAQRVQHESPKEVPVGNLRQAPSISDEAEPVGAVSLCLCGKTFQLDGDIDEFINFEGNSQNYFIADPLDSRCGELNIGVDLCADVVVAKDSTPVDGLELAAGRTGFGDAPSNYGGITMPSGFNVGRLFTALNDDLDPDGNPRNGTGVYFIAADISAPAEMDWIWNTQPVAFDVDGDGSRETQLEIARDLVGDAPQEQGDYYAISIDTDGNGTPDVQVKLAEVLDNVPASAVSIDPNDIPQIIDGSTVRRVVKFRDLTGTLPGTTQQQAVRFLDATQDGRIDWRDFGIGADIEFAVLNVSGLPQRPGPSHPRFWISAVAGDRYLGGTDTMSMRAIFPAQHDSSPCDDPSITAATPGATIGSRGTK